MITNYSKKTKNDDSMSIDNLVKITALFVHAAKIDDNYTSNEKEIIAINILGNLSFSRPFTMSNCEVVEDRAIVMDTPAIDLNRILTMSNRPFS